MNLLLLIVQLFVAEQGLASVYSDKVFACPRKMRIKQYPICAHRSLPCGSLITVKRLDNNVEVKCQIMDRGPYGICTPSHRNTRACGNGSKWSNGRNIIKNKIPMKLGTWRGILDMTKPLAKKLGVTNRLINVMIHTNIANNKLFAIETNDTDDPKLERIHNNAIILLERAESNDKTSITSNKGRR